MTSARRRRLVPVMLRLLPSTAVVGAVAVAVDLLLFHTSVGSAVATGAAAAAIYFLSAAFIDARRR